MRLFGERAVDGGRIAWIRNSFLSYGLSCLGLSLLLYALRNEVMKRPTTVNPLQDYISAPLDPVCLSKYYTRVIFVNLLSSS